MSVKKEEEEIIEPKDIFAPWKFSPDDRDNWTKEL